MKRPGLALQADLVQDNQPVEVTAGLFLGSIHAAFNAEAMHALGITHIVNASGLPPTFPQTFTYLSLELRDSDCANLLSCIPAANIFIEAGIEQGGGVLVHCAGGRSRSPALIVAFLMSTQGVAYAEALARVRRVRPVASINAGFEVQLLHYARADCDVYVAHQRLLYARMRDMARRWREGGAATLSDCRSPTSKEGKKWLQTRVTRLRLTRPGSGAVQVIPPLRGLGQQYQCRSCGEVLFDSNNIIRHDRLDQDEAAMEWEGWAGAGAGAGAVAEAKAGGAESPAGSKPSLRMQNRPRPPELKMATPRDERHAGYKGAAAAEKGEFDFEAKARPVTSPTDSSPPHADVKLSPRLLQHSPIRPMSSEKRRWLARMAPLSGGENPRLAGVAQADALAAERVLTCAYCFVEPLPWMSGFVDPTGDLNCPNARCARKLGSWNWGGRRCHCGVVVCPAFCIEISYLRVQERPLSRPASGSGSGSGPPGSGGLGAVERPPSGSRSRSRSGSRPGSRPGSGAGTRSRSGSGSRPGSGSGSRPGSAGVEGKAES